MMFTGIIEELGELRSASRISGGRRFDISCSPAFASGVAIGDSVAINGVCLTAIRVAENVLQFEAVEETVSRTTLADLATQTPLNLERSLTPATRMGGHFVLGHIDCIGSVSDISKPGLELRLTIAIQKEHLRHIIDKGSIAIDGISLTVAKLDEYGVQVAVIPHTWGNTNLRELRTGSRVNIETDVLGKYVHRLLCEGNACNIDKSKVDADFLRKHGFM
jgi:riboflavin synthase